MVGFGANCRRTYVSKVKRFMQVNLPEGERTSEQGIVPY